MKRITALMLCLSIVITCLIKPHTASAAEQDPVPSEINTFVNKATKQLKKLAIEKAKELAGKEAEKLIKMLLGINSFDQEEAFRKLTERMDEIAASQDWRLTKGEQEKRLSALQNAIQNAQQFYSLNMPFNLSSPGVSESGMALKDAQKETPFLRFFRESTTNGKTNWKQIIKERPRVNNNYVYDWRLGVPALMQLISLRIYVIAAVDPEYMIIDAFDKELQEYRDTILSHYKTMQEGVRCNDVVDQPVQIEDRTGRHGGYIRTRSACADIYTGDSSVATTYTNVSQQWLDQNQQCSSRDNSNCYPQGLLQSTVANDVSPVRARLRHEVVSRMPFFAMREMADTLGHYIKGGNELTRTGAISLTSANMCIEVQWANPNSGTRVWLQPCAWSDAQSWQYDRATGQIRNPVYNKCLDVQWGNRDPGTVVWTWDCIGGDAQRWTYDPITRVLQNALGTVLDTEFGSSAQGAYAMTWNRHELPNQQWTNRRINLNLNPKPKLF